jgi:hypothetical protein
LDIGASSYIIDVSNLKYTIGPERTRYYSLLLIFAEIDKKKVPPTFELLTLRHGRNQEDDGALPRCLHTVRRYDIYI